MRVQDWFLIARGFTERPIKDLAVARVAARQV